MPSPHLIIRKRMQLIQGKVRACCYVQAFVPADMQAVLEEQFLSEALFKRASYSASWPKGALAIPPAIAPSVAALLKNDACPEITVKTLLSGQLHQAANVWEMMSFEFIAKLAFENFMALARTAVELDHDIVYVSTETTTLPADLAAFEADTVAELSALDGTDLAA